MKAALAVTASLLAFGIPSQLGARPPPVDPDTFDVAIDLFSGDQPIGRPHFLVREGSTATMMAAEAGGYSIEVALSDDRASAPNVRTLTVDVSRPFDGRWMRIGRPTLTMPLGQQASMTFKVAGQSEFRMVATVTAHADPALSSTD